MGFDWRILLLARVRIARRVHCVQLVTAQRHNRTRCDLCIRQSRRSSAARLVPRERTLKLPNAHRRGYHHRLRRPHHDLRPRTHPHRRTQLCSRLRMPDTSVRLIFCAFLWLVFDVPDRRKDGLGEGPGSDAGGVELEEVSQEFDPPVEHGGACVEIGEFDGIS